MIGQNIVEVIRMEKRYEIGNFIYRLRTEQGYTQKELGALLGVTDKAVSKWETGAALPRSSVLQRLCEVLGCSQEELLLGHRTEKSEYAPASDQAEPLSRQENTPFTAHSSVFWKKARQILWWAELSLVLVLALLAAFFGFRRGIWERTTFFELREEGTKHVYTSRLSSAVEISNVTGLSTIVLCSRDGRTEHLLFQLFQSGSSKSLHIFTPDGSVLLSAIFHNGADDIILNGTDRAIIDYVQRHAQFNPGLGDQSICRMAFGLSTTRIAGRSGDFTVGVLFLILGLSFRFLTNAVIRLDIKLLGLFYQNTHSLRETGLVQGGLTLSGLFLFIVGLFLCCSVLFA